MKTGEGKAFSWLASRKLVPSAAREKERIKTISVERVGSYTTMDSYSALGKRLQHGVGKTNAAAVAAGSGKEAPAPLSFSSTKIAKGSRGKLI